MPIIWLRSYALVDIENRSINADTEAYSSQIIDGDARKSR